MSRQSFSKAAVLGAGLLLAFPGIAGAQLLDPFPSPQTADVTFQAPAVTTQDALVLGPTSARLIGVVDPNDHETKVFFQYGTNEALNLETPTVTVEAGATPEKVIADVSDLEPGSSFSYRLTAVTPTGAFSGGTNTTVTPGAGARGAVRVSRLTGELTSSGSGVTCTIAGTARRDSLRGTARKDIICGLGGNDRIRGLGGNDLILGGRGNDRLTGNGGRDRLYGNAGRDRLSAVDRRRGDSLNGGSGRDRAYVNRGDRVRSVERALRR